jgi:phospholipid/cholesterol/gamma-HCH transport system substrate-binding protein
MKRSTFITWDQLKVGVIILLAFSILGFAIFRLGAIVGLFASRYELVAFVANTSGLRIGGSVTVAGQLAGTVKSIVFLPVDSDTTRNLIITVDLDKRLKEQVREDSRARLRTQGLLGDKIFDISPGTLDANPLEPGDTLIVSPTLDYEQVIAQAASAVDDMVGLTGDLREITGGIVRGEGTMGQMITNRSLYDQLDRTLSSANQLLTRLQAPSGTFGRMLDDPTLYNRMNEMVARMDSLVAKVNSSEGSLNMFLTDTTLYRKATGIMTNADSLLRMVTQGDGFASKMLTDQQLYDQMLKAITEMNALITDIRLNPGKYFRIRF